MTANVLNLTAIAFYSITWVLIIKSVLACINSTTQAQSPSKIYFIPWLIALITHITSCVTPLSTSDQLSFSFASLGTHVMWFISLILFLSTLGRKIQSLSVAILPLTILSIILVLFSQPDTNSNIIINSGLGFHVLISLLAYSILMLAAFQAALLATQNNFLHKRINNQKQSNFFKTLPALEDMEYFLFHLIRIGVLLLTISLLSGFYYLENLFGSNVAHKTVLSILSWVIFSALIVGRWKYGWRGKTAVKWTLAGFVLLALAFFGSKFIQEFIIKKDTAYLSTPPHFMHKTVQLNTVTDPMYYTSLSIEAFNYVTDTSSIVHTKQTAKELNS